MKKLKLDLKSIEADVAISDGYHTFDELYEHRIELYINYCRLLADLYAAYDKQEYPWRSKIHSDGTKYKGWFLLGVGKKKGEQVTYHIPLSRWDDVEFAETLKKAPEFDGHTSKDVLKRLKYF